MSSKTYQGQDIQVTFELKRCIHAAECGRRLQSVFDIAKRPWVQPDNATADQVQEAVDNCPSGALKYVRLDGGPQEQRPDKNMVVVTDSGEYQLHGEVHLTTMDGETIAEEYRLTLCRCGESHNKPFCDNTHQKTGFAAPSEVADNAEETVDLHPTGKLKVVTATHGPLLLQGNFQIQDVSGQQIFRGEKAALCRCGGSANKPFCDGSHAAIEFKAP